MAAHAKAVLSNRGTGDGDGDEDDDGDDATARRALAASVACYRGGYAAADRRAIEAGLFGGSLLGVATTNALELGVDVGDLDATLHVGIPPTASSLWQQVGRAGRRGSPSLHILIAHESPLDQFYVRRPAALVARAPEAVRCDPGAPGLLALHVAAAAAEAPLRLDVDSSYFGPTLPAVASDLVAAGVLAVHPHAVGGVGGTPFPLHYCGAASAPASTFGLRSIDADKFVVQDEAGTPLEEVEAGKAFFSLYDGAVHLLHGRTHIVRSLNVTTRTAIVVRKAVNYFTRPVDATAVTLVGAGVALGDGGGGSGDGGGGDNPSPPAAVGPAVVTTRFYSFERVWRSSGVPFDRVPLFLPDVAFETVAAHVPLPHRAVVEALKTAAASTPHPLDPASCVHAAAHALAAVAPAILQCAPSVVACECVGVESRLLLYDAHPGGGVGVARSAGARFGELLAAAAALVEGCGCGEPSGCPACVQTSTCRAYNEALCAAGAGAVLALAGRVVRGER